MMNFNTDLADERNSIYRKANNIENNVDGIETEEKEINDKVKISRVKITNEVWLIKRKVSIKKWNVRIWGKYHSFFLKNGEIWRS